MVSCKVYEGMFTSLGFFDFDEMPRVGEKIEIRGKRVYEIREVKHLFHPGSETEALTEIYVNNV